jgi:hypothetical protein
VRFCDQKRSSLGVVELVMSTSIRRTCRPKRHRSSSAPNSAAAPPMSGRSPSRHATTSMTSSSSGGIDATWSASASDHAGRSASAK